MVGFLFDAANYDYVCRLALIIPSAIPMIISIILSALIVGIVGVVLMILSAQISALAMFLIYGLGYAFMYIADELPVEKDFALASKKEDARANAVMYCAIGLTIAYWIAYRFYMLWIR